MRPHIRANSPPRWAKTGDAAKKLQPSWMESMETNLWRLDRVPPLRVIAALRLDVEEQVRAGLVDVCVNMQLKTSEMAERFVSEMGRYYYVTPKNYLDFINTYLKLLDEKDKFILSQVGFQFVY